MRLTCPRCGAQYEIDAAAIPAAGRDVECSACSHVWYAAPTDSAAAFDPAERPPLSRPLNESILSVLREEAARELQARTDDTGAAPSPAVTGEPPNAGDPDWPATTVTHPAPRMSADILAQRMERDFAEVEGDKAAAAVPQLRDNAEDSATAPAVVIDETAKATDSETTPTGVVTADEKTVAQHDRDSRPGLTTAAPPAMTVTAPEPASAHHVAPSTPRRAVRHLPPGSAPSGEPRRSSGRGAYNAGFNLAFMAALVVLALYALAPRLADQGAFGSRLMEWRMQADQGRDWLQTRADRVVENLRP